MNKRSLFVGLVLAVMAALASALFSGCKEKSDISVTPIQRPFKYPGQGGAALQAVKAVQEKYSGELLRNGEVVGTGIGTDPDGTPVLVIYTTRPGLTAVPEVLDGVLTRQHCMEGASQAVK